MAPSPRGVSRRDHWQRGFDNATFAELLTSAFDELELRLLAWQTLGEHIPAGLSPFGVAAEIMGRVAEHPMEKTLLVAQVAYDRPARADEFFTAYQALADEYGVYSLPRPATPEELDLDAIAGRFGGTRPVATGFNLAVFKLSAGQGWFGNGDDLALLARTSIAANMPQSVRGETASAAHWLLDQIGGDPARQTLVLAKALRDQVRAGKSTDYSEPLYAGVARAYGLPLSQDPKNLDLNAIAAHFGITDYAVRTAFLILSTPKGARYVFADELTSLLEICGDSSRTARVLQSAGYATDSDFRNVFEARDFETCLRLAVRIVGENKTGKGNPALLLQGIVDLNPYREDVRQTVVTALGEPYTPLSAAQRFPGSPRLDDSRIVSQYGHVYFPPYGLAALFDACSEVWGDDVERVRDIAKGLGLDGSLPGGSDVLPVIWALLGAAQRHGYMESLLAVLQADAPDNAALQAFNRRWKIAAGSPSQANTLRMTPVTGVITPVRAQTTSEATLANIGLTWQGHQLVMSDRDKFSAYLRQVLRVDATGNLSLAALVFADFNLEWNWNLFVDTRTDKKVTEAMQILADGIQNKGIIDGFLVRLHERRPGDLITAALAREIRAH